MSATEETLAAIDELGSTTWSGLLYRHTAPQRDALSGEGARIFGGRWNPVESTPTVYFADSVDACVAEFARLAATQGGRRAFRPRSLHTVRAWDLEILDLSHRDAIEAVGLSLSDVLSADRKPCQDVGEGAFFLGRQGVLAPSAADDQGLILAAFTVRLLPSQLELLETTSLPGD